MFVLDEANGSCEGEVVGDEDGFGIADAEWAAAGEPIHEGWGDVVDLKFGVADERGREEWGGEDWGGVGVHAGAEEGEVGGRQREAYGVGVASEASEERGEVPMMDGGEGVEEVEAGDGAAGAVGLLVFVGEDEGGAAGAVDYAGGEDAEDSAMPGGVVEDDASGGEGLVRVAHGFELALDGVEGVGFGGATGGVEAVEFLGQFLRAAGVTGEEELDYVAGDVHAAGGVDAGGDAEAYFGGGGGAVEGDLGDLHEGAQAGLDGVAELAEAEGYDGSVFAGEWDGVGDGGDGYQLEE